MNVNFECMKFQQMNSKCNDKQNGAYVELCIKCFVRVSVGNFTNS